MGGDSSSVADAIPTQDEGDALFDELFGDLIDEPDDTPAAPVAAAPPAPPAPPAHDDDLPPPPPPPREEAPTLDAVDDDDRETFRPPPPTAEADDDGLIFDDAVVEPTLGEAVIGVADYVSGDELADTNQLPRAELPPGMGDPVPYAEPYEMPPVQAAEDEDDDDLIFDDVVVAETPPIPSASQPPPPEEDDDDDGVTIAIDASDLLAQVEAAVGGAGTPLAGSIEISPDVASDLDEGTMVMDPAEAAGLQAGQALPEAVGAEPLIADRVFAIDDEVVEVDGESIEVEESVVIDEASIEIDASVESVEVATESVDFDDVDLELVDVEPVEIEMDGAEAVAFEADLSGNDAVVSLVQSGERDAWAERASWLYREAPPASDQQGRANALLVVAELHAMAGEEERADQVAREALQLAPSSPLAHRQLRGLLLGRGRYTELVDALDAEARVAPSVEAKFHAHYMAGEVERLALGDPDSSRRRVDQADRAAADDIRVQIARLSHGLGSSDVVPEVDVSGAHAEQLEAALAVISALRSDGAMGDSSGGTYAALLTARASLRTRDMSKVVAALRTLEGIEEFGAGAAWLIAALASTNADLRSEAVAALDRVSQGSHGALAIRARAARALEAGDHAVAVDVANEADDDVLNPGERLVIAALAGRPLAEHVSWLTRGSQSEESAPIAAASSALFGEWEQQQECAVGDGSVRAESLLGRQLAGVLAPSDAEEPPEMGLPEQLVAGADALLDADPTHGAARALLLEHYHASGQAIQIVDTVASEAAAGLEAERPLLAALVAEAAGAHDRMAQELERVLDSSPGDEAALRMALVVADAAGAAAMLMRHGEAVDDSVRSAIALTEAGLRLMEVEGQEADGEAVLRKAAEISEHVPIGEFIGMYIASALGDREGERFWLDHRRATAGDPAVAVADSIRAALRTGPDELAERASYLEEAHRARPQDYTLRDLYEQASGGAGDRGEWLAEQLQAESGSADAALEAAVAFEVAGDFEQAARAVHKAITAGDDRLAPVIAQRHALMGIGAGRVVEGLESALRQATEPADRVELALALAEIEAEGRGDHARALEVLRGVLDQGADDLVLLYRLQALSIAEGVTSELAPVTLAIAKVLDGPESVAQATLAARLIRASQGADKMTEAVETAFATGVATPWIARQMGRLASAKGDHDTAATIYRSLAEQQSRPLDQATLMVRGAEAYLGAGRDDDAAELLGSALDVAPRHIVALLNRAGLLERSGDVEAAAEAYEELAMASAAPEQRAAQLYKAASIWLSLEEGAGTEEGRRLLEAVSAIDPDYEDTFERLQAIYLALGAKRELADLLGARLDGVTDPAKRVELEVLRGKMLVEAGSAGEARDALAAALEANPDNPDALSAYADVCAAEEDWEAVEQSIIRLGRLVSEPEAQVDIYLRLGTLYYQHLPNAERAEMAYQEVLKREPDHLGAREALVALFLDSGDTAKAFEQQKALVDGAKSHADKCTHTVRMAEIHEAAGELKEAEQVLVKARRTWSKEATPVLALYRFYKRTGQDPAADMLLDRASAEVRRGLGAGRFEAGLFALAKMVAEMRDQADAARIADATLAAIEGRVVSVGGAGLAAGQPELDEHCAPEIFTSQFRQILAASGHLMDLAVPYDIGSLRAKPLPPPQAHVLDRTMEIAAGYGLTNVQVLATNALGRVVIPAAMDPPTLVFGLQLVTAEQPAVRDFMIHRALKVLQTRTAALARTAPIDLWPLVAAFLRLHSPSFDPSGVDAAKLAKFHAAMAPHSPKPGPQMSLLTSEVIKSMGNRASSLNTQANAWGSRCGLLAQGEPTLALEGIAWSSGSTQGPPPAGAERLRWIGRQAEARDLIVFAVGDGYAAARAALGIDGDVAPEPVAAEQLEELEPESVDFIDVDMD
jgi:lipopolysaccharide biosynthesis regulator YciM